MTERPKPFRFLFMDREDPDSKSCLCDGTTFRTDPQRGLVHDLWLEMGSTGYLENGDTLTFAPCPAHIHANKYYDLLMAFLRSWFYHANVSEDMSAHQQNRLRAESLWCLAEIDWWRSRMNPQKFPIDKLYTRMAFALLLRLGIDWANAILQARVSRATLRQRSSVDLDKEWIGYRITVDRLCELLDLPIDDWTPDMDALITMVDSLSLIKDVRKDLPMAEVKQLLSSGADNIQPMFREHVQFLAERLPEQVEDYSEETPEGDRSEFHDEICQLIKNTRTFAATLTEDARSWRVNWLEQVRHLNDNPPYVDPNKIKVFAAMTDHLASGNQVFRERLLEFRGHIDRLETLIYADMSGASIEVAETI
ncbi:hypothetical protein JX266_000509 [Neoarthrinium moseri]|nr:hypothetical protein JX266_000509 [Neoarthrinium moseri]